MPGHKDKPGSFIPTRYCGLMLFQSNWWRHNWSQGSSFSAIKQSNWNDVLRTEGMGQKGISWDAIKAIQCICVDTDSKMPGTQSHSISL